jgi:hypothetical protein
VCSSDLSLGAGAGWKAWASTAPAPENTWDAHLDVALSRDFGPVNLSPAVHAAWTDLADRAPLASTFVWGGLDVGLAL